MTHDEDIRRASGRRLPIAPDEAPSSKAERSSIPELIGKAIGLGILVVLFAGFLGLAVRCYHLAAGF